MDMNSEMNEITLDNISPEETFELFDKNLEFVFIHRFVPNEVVEWWKTDLKTKDGVVFKDLLVRQMEMDVQTNLERLKKILSLNNTYQLRIYQFDRAISNTFEIHRIPKNSWEKILRQNGLRHCFYINFEFITIKSFDPEFVRGIENNPVFKQRFNRIK